MQVYIQWAFFSVVSSVIYHLVLKEMSNEGYDHTILLIWLHLVMIAFLILNYWRDHLNDFSITDRGKLLTNSKFIALATLGGFMSYLTHHYGYEAFLRFRNPGYYQAIMGLELVGITVFATLIFSSHLGLKEIIGISLIMIGSIIMTWSENKAGSAAIH